MFKGLSSSDEPVLPEATKLGTPKIQAGFASGIGTAPAFTRREDSCDRLGDDRFPLGGGLENPTDVSKKGDTRKRKKLTFAVAPHRMAEESWEEFA